MADNIDIHEAAKADAPALTSAQRIKRALANGLVGFVRLLSKMRKG